MPENKTLGGGVRTLLARYSPLVILAGLCLTVAILSPDFRTTNNLQSVVYRTSVAGIVASGQVLVILTGGIDLSVGAVAALSGVVGCMLMKHVGAFASLGILGGSLTGLVCGLICGLLVAKGRVAPFIVTLGMMMTARGATLLLSGGLPVSGAPATFEYLGGTRIWWIPVVITLTINITLGVILAFTRFGRALYATGGNMVAARLSGISVDRVRILAYSLCGMLAGFAGMVLASRTSGASPTAGEGLELEAIAGCVIGGASLMGGEGGALGALAGALIKEVLVNFCNLKNYDQHWQSVLIGVLIVILVSYDNYRKRRAGLFKD